jgi:hypothetical protein
MPGTQPVLTQRRERNDCVKAKLILFKDFTCKKDQNYHLFLMGR